MATINGASRRGALPFLERIFTGGGVVGLSEEQLLARFVDDRDQAAFEAIVTRHGPMVLRVCRQLLNDPNDVDDAFQATFIVLARRASSLGRRELLGNWLYGVALRVARRARTLAARRASRLADETPVERVGAAAPQESDLDFDTRVQLHEAVDRLPDRYRIPIVLCYFDGLTHQEAADRLGWPLGSVKGRLAGARDLLRKRLVRCGVGLAAGGAVLAGLERSAGAANVPRLLQIKTIQSALAVSGLTARDLAGAAAIPLTVATLAQGVTRTMIVSQIRSLVIPVLVGAGLISAGGAAVAFQPGSNTESAVGSSDHVPKKKLHKHPDSSNKEAARPDKSTANKPQPQATPGGMGGMGPGMMGGGMPGMGGMGGGMMMGGGMGGMGPGMMGGGMPGGMGGMGGMGPGMMGGGMPGMGSGTGPGMMGRGWSIPGFGGGMSGMGGGMGSGMTGRSMGGGMMMGADGLSKSPQASAWRKRIDSLRRQWNAEAAATVAEADKNPRTTEILKKLEKPVAMNFDNKTPLEEALKYIWVATGGEKSAGITAYVDPVGLAETEHTLQSTVTINVEGAPLKTTLRLVLKQLDLAYCVHDGVLVISSPRGIREELDEARSELGVSRINPALEEELQKLENNPFGMRPFGGPAAETPGGRK